MGKTLMGGNTTFNPQTRQQQRFQSQLIRQLGPDAISAYQGILQGMDPQQMEQIFQRSYVDPAIRSYEQNVLPSIKQSFADAGSSSSSALNQALAQSAADVSTMLGSQYGQFAQNQQAQTLQALGLLNPSFQQGQQTMIHQPGILGDLISAGGRVAAAKYGA